MRELGTILGVWAHPDDETFLTSGLMASSVRDGNRVVVVTATRGEEGSWDEERWPTPKMGEIREAELMESLRIVGVTEHRWLDYYDGKCSQVPSDEGISKVRTILDEVRPDTVMTFGPDGMTGHPDHIAVSTWATEAFHLAARPGAKLYYATVTPDWYEEWVPKFARFDTFGPGTPPVTPREELAIEFSLSQELLDLKVRAIEAHLSQVEGMKNAFGEDFLRESNKEEFFRLGAIRIEQGPLT